MHVAGMYLRSESACRRHDDERCWAFFPRSAARPGARRFFFFSSGGGGMAVSGARRASGDEGRQREGRGCAEAATRSH